MPGIVLAIFGEREAQLAAGAERPRIVEGADQHGRRIPQIRKRHGPLGSDAVRFVVLLKKRSEPDQAERVIKGHVTVPEQNQILIPNRAGGRRQGSGLLDDALDLVLGLSRSQIIGSLQADTDQSSPR